MRCPFTDLPRTERQIQATSLLLTASDARYYGTLAALENGQRGRSIGAILMYVLYLPRTIHYHC